MNKKITTKFEKLDKLVEQIIDIPKPHEYIDLSPNTRWLGTDLSFLFKTKKERTKILQLAQAELSPKHFDAWVNQRMINAQVLEYELFAHLDFPQRSLEDLEAKLQQLYKALSYRLSIAEWCIYRLNGFDIYKQALELAGQTWKKAQQEEDEDK